MKRICISLCCVALLLTSCLPGPTGTHGSRVITVYAFSIMKESLEKDIFPAFAEKWKQEHGEDVSFNTSFSGSETVTNQILQGAPADIAILSIEMDVQRLIKGGFDPVLGLGPREVVRYIADDYARWEPIVKKLTTQH